MHGEFHIFHPVEIPVFTIFQAATGGQVIYLAQAVPAVSINSSQQPPPYALAVNQPLPAGYYSNPGLQQNSIQDLQQKSSNPTV